MDEIAALEAKFGLTIHTGQAKKIKSFTSDGLPINPSSGYWILLDHSRLRSKHACPESLVLSGRFS